MTRREKRRLYAQYLSDIEQDRNGRPIPGEILERMTRPKEPDQLWQVMVRERATGDFIPMGPMACKDAAGMWAEAANRAILAGNQRDWLIAEIRPMTPIQ